MYQTYLGDGVINKWRNMISKYRTVVVYHDVTNALLICLEVQLVFVSKEIDIVWFTLVTVVKFQLLVTTDRAFPTNIVR